MNTKTISTRSNATLTTYVKTVDRMRVLAHELAQLERQERDLRPAVLQQLEGDELRPVTISKALRIVKRSRRYSVKIVDAERALSWAKERGVKVSTRTPEYLAPQTVREAAIRGEVPSDVAAVETEEIIVIE